MIGEITRFSFGVFSLLIVLNIISAFAIKNDSESIKYVVLGFASLLSLVVAGPFLYKTFYRQSEEVTNLYIGTFRGQDIKQICRDKNTEYQKKYLPKVFTKTI